MHTENDCLSKENQYDRCEKNMIKGLCITVLLEKGVAQRFMFILILPGMEDSTLQLPTQLYLGKECSASQTMD